MFLRKREKSFSLLELNIFSSALEVTNEFKFAQHLTLQTISLNKNSSPSECIFCILFIAIYLLARCMNNILSVPRIFHSCYVYFLCITLFRITFHSLVPPCKWMQVLYIPIRIIVVTVYDPHLQDKADVSRECFFVVVSNFIPRVDEMIYKWQIYAF